jgi:hypothetical protein
MGSGTPDDEHSTQAPAIPSFASLRGGARRSPADALLYPERASTRPPEWADLWLLGLRVARWCVHQPIRTVRRLIG